MVLYCESFNTYLAYGKILLIKHNASLSLQIKLQQKVSVLDSYISLVTVSKPVFMEVVKQAEPKHAAEKWLKITIKGPLSVL